MPLVAASSPKVDPKLEVAASLVPGRPGEPTVMPRATDPERPAETATQGDVSREGLNRLRSMARDHAEQPEGKDRGDWVLHCRLLDWLIEPDSLNGSGPESERNAESDAGDGSLRKLVLPHSPP